MTRERFEKLVEALPVDPPENLPLSIITPDIQELGMPDLSDEAGQQALEPFVDEADLIVVDSISTLVINGRENETESWVPIQAWALKQRVKRKTILFIHHAGKGGDQRGSSKREDVLDTVIALKRPTGYSPEEGARFEVHFTKSRGFHGEDAERSTCLYLQMSLVGSNGHPRAFSKVPTNECWSICGRVYLNHRMLHSWRLLSRPFTSM